MSEAWTLLFPDKDPAWQVFRLASPNEHEARIAAEALAEARSELPGVREFDLVWFTGSLAGYWYPNDPDRIFLRVGAEARELRRVVRHEVGDAAHYARHGEVGPEDVADRYAAGDAAAIALLRAYVDPLAPLRADLIAAPRLAVLHSEA